MAIILQLLNSVLQTLKSENLISIITLWETVLLCFVKVIGHLSLEGDNKSEYGEMHNRLWVIRTIKTGAWGGGRKYYIIIVYDNRQ